MFKFIIATTLAVGTFAQPDPDREQNGYIDKSTWASSDPELCEKVFFKYLNVVESNDGCPDEGCECATQGRVQFVDGTDYGGHGLHAINCTQHPYGDLSLADVEEKIAERTGDFTSFHPFMDFVTAIWTNDLDTLIDDLQTDSMDFLPLVWNTKDNTTYYSVIFKPCGYIHLELVGNSVSNANKALFQAHDRPRVFFNDRSNVIDGETGVDADYLTALHVSRATARMDEVKAFYTADLNVSTLHSETFEDGSEVLVVAFNTENTGSRVQVVFWSGRVVENPIENEDEWSVELWENYVRGVHDEIMINSFCGNDQWMDNHYAVSGDNDLSDYTDHADTLGLPYHWWALGTIITQVYISDPTGWSVQFSGSSTRAPWYIPEYSASCESNDGCAGQGKCSSQSMTGDLIKWLMNN